MKRAFGGIAVMLGAGAGCLGNLDEMAAQEATDFQEVAANESALMSANVDDSMTGMKAADIAAQAVGRAQARFLPAGCATVTRTDTVVTYVLQDCTGPHGLLHLTGTATAAFSDAADGVHIAVRTEDMKVNRATYSGESNGVLSQDAGKKKVAVSTTGGGVGARGTRFTRTGQFTAVGDPESSCLDLSGQWQLTVGGAKRSTTITDLHACKGKCPLGGRIDHQGFRGREITVTFDGSALAHWTSSTGRDGTVSLNCSP